MKERPILFSSPMVRAILAGTKTQTRRVVRPQPSESGLEWATACGGEFAAWQDPGLLLDEYSEDGGPCQRVCPYGRPRDRLWLREAWSHTDGTGLSGGVLYRADFDDGPRPIKYRPSIHMPRWASRITLEVTGVRVERLQDISEADAIAEGIDLNASAIGIRTTGESPQPMAIAIYRSLWESINGPQSWDANPWVWVVEFRRIEKETT